jgi:hypothetical protein
MSLEKNETLRAVAASHSGCGGAGGGVANYNGRGFDKQGAFVGRCPIFEYGGIQMLALRWRMSDTQQQSEKESLCFSFSLSYF